VGKLELAPLLGRGAREGSLLVAEQLALDEFLRDGRAVHLDEGLLRPLAQVVDRAGHEFLSRAVFSHDEDPGVRRGDDPDHLLQIDDGLALADELEGRGDLLLEELVFFLEAGQIEGVVDEQHHLFQGDGLLDEVKGAELGRFYGGLDGTMP
jgi:hypothetical protein